MTQRSTGGGLIAGISMGPVANFGQHIAGTAGSTSLGSRAPHAVAPSAAVPYPPTDQPLGLAPPLQAASGGARAASPAAPPAARVRRPQTVPVHRRATWTVTFPDMVFASYVEAVEVMRRPIRPATSEQLDLACLTGCDVPPGAPLLIAAAYLHSHLDPVIDGGGGRRPASDRQLSFLIGLAGQDLADSNLSMRVASAWIDYYLTVRAIKRLEDLERVHSRGRLSWAVAPGLISGDRVGVGVSA